MMASGARLSSHVDLLYKMSEHQGVDAERATELGSASQFSNETASRGSTNYDIKIVDCPGVDPVCKISGTFTESLVGGTEKLLSIPAKCSQAVNGGSFALSGKVGPKALAFTPDGGKVCESESFKINLAMLGAMGTGSWPGLGCPKKAGKVKVSLGLNLAELKRATRMVAKRLGAIQVKLEATATDSTTVLTCAQASITLK